MYVVQGLSDYGYFTFIISPRINNWNTDGFRQIMSAILNDIRLPNSSNFLVTCKIRIKTVAITVLSEMVSAYNIGIKF